MVNKCIIVGRLGKDVDVRYTTSNKKVAQFTVATESGYGDKAKTEWHNIVAWDKLAEICENYLSKGKLVYVEGRIQTRNWDDKDGNKRYTTEIVADTLKMLDKKSEDRPVRSPVKEDEDIPF